MLTKNKQITQYNRKPFLGTAAHRPIFCWKPNFYTAKNLLSSFELKEAYLKWIMIQIA